MTNEIEELEALLEKATPGPWGVETTDGVFKQTVSKSTEVGEPDSVICDNEPYYPQEVSEDNQNFIAAARNQLPALLQSLKDKDAEIERFNALSVLRWKEVETILGDTIHTASTPFGSYAITADADDGSITWAYCFDEYYDEDECDIESVEAGKIKAQEHWTDRLFGKQGATND